MVVPEACGSFGHFFVHWRSLSGLADPGQLSSDFTQALVKHSKLDSPGSIQKVIKDSK